MQYLEPSPQSWHLTYLRAHLPWTFSVEAGALPPSTQHRSRRVDRNAEFASSALLFVGDPSAVRFLRLRFYSRLRMGSNPGRSHALFHAGKSFSTSCPVKIVAYISE